MTRQAREELEARHGCRADGHDAGQDGEHEPGRTPGRHPQHAGRGHGKGGRGTKREHVAEQRGPREGGIRQPPAPEIRQSHGQAAGNGHQRSDEQASRPDHIQLPEADSAHAGPKREEKRSVQEQLRHELEHAGHDQHAARRGAERAASSSCAGREMRGHGGEQSDHDRRRQPPSGRPAIRPAENPVPSTTSSIRQLLSEASRDLAIRTHPSDASVPRRVEARRRCPTRTSGETPVFAPAPR